MRLWSCLKVDDGLVTPEQLRQERQGELPSGSIQTYPQMAGEFFFSSKEWMLVEIP